MQSLKLCTASCKGLLGRLSMTEFDIPILLRGCGVSTSLVKPYVYTMFLSYGAMF